MVRQFRSMIDLNDLRVFEQVGSRGSFAAAARALSEPKSNVSRSIARLESTLGVRLFQRTTREVVLTAAGERLMARCAGALGQLQEVSDDFSSITAEPRGDLRLSVGIGFGINVLGEQLPAFLRRYPGIKVMVDLTSRIEELVSSRVDVAIRLGPLPDSSMVAVRLGEMKRVLCASPAYLQGKYVPRTLADLAAHELIEMPGTDGRPRTWSFVKDGRTTEVIVEPRVCVNDALTIHRLVVNGAGIGIISCYLCAPEIKAGRLMPLLTDFTAPVIAANLVFPSKRELAPTVRAFVDFMKEANPAGLHWQNNDVPLAHAAE